MDTKSFFRLRNEKGQYWSYGSKCGNIGKAFNSKESLIYSFKANVCKPKGTFQIVEQKYVATEEVFEDLSGPLFECNVDKFLRRKYCEQLAKHWVENKGFGDFTHYLNAYSTKHSAESIKEIIKNSSFKRTDYRKSGDAFFIMNSDLAVVLTLSLSGLSISNFTTRQTLVDQVEEIRTNSIKEEESWQ